MMINKSSNKPHWFVCCSSLLLLRALEPQTGRGEAKLSTRPRKRGDWVKGAEAGGRNTNTIHDDGTGKRNSSEELKTHVRSARCGARARWLRTAIAGGSADDHVVDPPRPPQWREAWGRIPTTTDVSKAYETALEREGKGGMKIRVAKQQE
jgi:hypothetical protein